MVLHMDIWTTHLCSKYIGPKKQESIVFLIFWPLLPIFLGQKCPNIEHFWPKFYRNTSKICKNTLQKYVFGDMKMTKNRKKKKIAKICCLDGKWSRTEDLMKKKFFWPSYDNKNVRWSPKSKTPTKKDIALLKLSPTLHPSQFKKLKMT